MAGGTHVEARHESPARPAGLGPRRHRRPRRACPLRGNRRQQETALGPRRVHRPVEGDPQAPAGEHQGELLRHRLRLRRLPARPLPRRPRPRQAHRRQRQPATEHRALRDRRTRRIRGPHRTERAMLGAIRDGIELLRKHGAGAEIKGHRDGYATTCPGVKLYAWVKKGAPRPHGTAAEPGTSASTKRKVSLAHIVYAAKHDPAAAQGHTTYEAEVLLVEKALRAEGLLARSTSTAPSASRRPTPMPTGSVPRPAAATSAMRQTASPGRCRSSGSPSSTAPKWRTDPAPCTATDRVRRGPGGGPPGP